jgi:tRNA wybutosine-synthesizing protein 1
VSTYTDGTPPESAAWFYKFVTEMAVDWRYEKDTLKGLNYSICGLGNSLYEENFNTIAKQLDKSFSSLNANRIAPLYLCDENTIKSRHTSLEGDVEFWQNNFFEKLEFYIKTKLQSKKEEQPTSGESCCQGSSTNNAGSCCQDTESKVNAKEKNENPENDEEEDDESSEKYEDTTEDEDNQDDEEEANYFSDIDEELNDENQNSIKVKKQKNGLIDMEDLGAVVNNIKAKKNKKDGEPKEMITPLLRKSLEKQGYKLIGSHSGVKLCRWTKSMLRGFSFFTINFIKENSKLFLI